MHRDRITVFLRQLFRKRLVSGLLSFVLRLLSVLPLFWSFAVFLFLTAGFYLATGVFAWLVLAGMTAWLAFRYPWNEVPLSFDLRENGAFADRLLSGRGRVESAACFLADEETGGLVERHLAGVASSLPSRPTFGPFLPRVFRYAASGGLLLLILQIFLFPAVFSRSGSFLFGFSRGAPPRVTLEYPRTVPRGGSFLLDIRTDAPEASVNLDHDGERYMRRPERVPGGFRLRLARVTRTLRFRVSAGDAAGRHEGKWRRVRVLRPLYISRVRFRILYPAYTGRTPETVENESRFRLPYGSRLFVSGEANLPLESSRVLYGDGTVRRCLGKGRTFRTEIPVTRPLAFRFSVKAAGGRTNAAPLVYRIGLLKDLAPVVRILSPGQDMTAPRRLMIPLIYDVSDDYGIKGVTLEYVIHHPGSRERGTLPLPGEGTGGVLRHVWDVNRLPVSPGETVRYRITARDGRGQTGRSREYALRLPTLAELFARADKKQDEIRRQLQRLAQERARTLKRLERLERERGNTGKTDREQTRREVHRLREERRRLAKELRKLEKNLRRQEDRHSRGALFSEKTVRALQEVREAIRKLRLRMDTPLMKLDGKNLPRLSLVRQKNFEKELQRQLKQLLAALKRMEHDRKLDLARGRLKSAENALRRSLKERAGRRSSTLQREASRLTKDAAAGLKQSAKDHPSAQIRSLLDKMARDLGKQGLSGKLSKMADSNQGGGERQRSGKRMLEQMRQMRRQLAALTAAGRRALGAKLLGDLETSAEEVLFLTRRFRDIRREYGSIPSAWMQGAGPEQDRMLALLTRIGEQTRLVISRRQALEKALAGLSFMMPPPVFLLRRSTDGLNGLRDRLQNRRTVGVSRYMAAVGRDLGAAVVEIIKMADGMRRQMKGSGKGAGQGMGDLAGKQQQLDRKLQELMKRLAAGKLTPEERKQLAELAALQRLIRQSLARGNREQGRMLGDMKRLLAEMKKIEDALRSGRLDKETVRRERQVLDRLLRGTRAMRRMGKKDQRKADSAAGSGLEDSVGTIPARILRVRRMLGDLEKQGGGRDRDLLRRYLKFLYRELGERQ